MITGISVRFLLSRLYRMLLTLIPYMHEIHLKWRSLEHRLCTTLRHIVNHSPFEIQISHPGWCVFMLMLRIKLRTQRWVSKSNDQTGPLYQRCLHLGYIYITKVFIRDTWMINVSSLNISSDMCLTYCARVMAAWGNLNYRNSTELLSNLWH